MPRSLSNSLDGLTRGLVYALVFLMPLFLLPAALDPLELNKQTLLVALTLCAFLSFTVSMVARRRFELRHGWLNVVPVIVLGATVASAFGSSSPYLSWIGGSSQEYVSVLTVFALALLFYVIVNRVSEEREHRAVHGLSLVSAGIVGMIGTVSALRGDTFNTVGTMNALAVYLSAMTVFGCGLWVASRPDHALLHGGWLGRIEKLLVLLVSAETLVVMLAINYVVLWTILLTGLAILFGFFFLRANDIHDARRFLLPLTLLSVCVLYLFRLPSPIHTNIPLEVTPSFSASTDIARQVLDGSSGLFGSGPGTFQFDYALLHASDVNQTQLWAQRFDRGASFFHTLAPGVGIVGLFAWGAFLLSVFGRGAARVLVAKEYREWAIVLVGLAGWCVFAVAAFLYPGNMTSVFFLFVFSALIASRTSRQGTERFFVQSSKIGYVFTASVILVSVGILTVMFVGAQRYRSEVAFARAARLSEQGADTKDIADELDRAATYNRFNDAAYRQLSQSLLRRVDEEIAMLADDSAVTPEAREYVRALTAAAVNASVRATDLSPRNALNWLSRGSVYRALIQLVGNAGDFSVFAFEHAAELEPLNPANRVELGKTYLALAESVRDLTGSDDAAVAAEAQAKLDAYLASAEIAFNKAVELKADYAPAHYQLAVTYDRQGRLDDAVGKMESVMRYNQYDVGVAFQLGLLYLRRGEDGDLERAQVELERAVELAPAYANARWFLATIYEQQGNLALSIAQIEKVLEYNPGNQIVTERLNRLRSGVAATTIPDAIE
ncbi:hypothetical protein A2304_02385 [Candidatus Uhrbacteria bacterium RIFOXYB2_FULL_57_15]|uniref:Uncharacterized protein n=1 Tax=Candidatus Uhrbacteria bacterium RIFOXYB2_FULL_57_15 TaxID=1802422 RepID=A0A1F7W9E2_9BACT|nr:MAG: hypothetical protein A2304_02385 [Candidatus Uhrbacteria bacterium RIFOXYB2_FULL_57_15]